MIYSRGYHSIIEHDLHHFLRDFSAVASASSNPLQQKITFVQKKGNNGNETEQIYF